MKVRPFQDDYDQIGRLIQEAQKRKETYFTVPKADTQEKFEKLVKRPHVHLIVIEEEEQVIGFGGIDLVRKKGDPNADLLGIVVDYKYQNQGIGEYLFDELINIAQKQGIQSIFVRIGTENETGARFLEKQGFRYKRTYYELEMTEKHVQKVQESEHIQINKVTNIDDENAFVEIYQEIFHNEEEAREKLQYLKDPNKEYEMFFMYKSYNPEKAPKLIGFCGVENTGSKEVIRRVDTLGVLDNYARRGRGKLLFMETINYYWRQPNTSKIIITLKSSSPNVVKFYLSCGMKETWSTESYKYEILSIERTGMKE